MASKKYKIIASKWKWRRKTRFQHSAIIIRSFICNGRGRMPGPGTARPYIFIKPKTGSLHRIHICAIFAFLAVFCMLIFYFSRMPFLLFCCCCCCSRFVIIRSEIISIHKYVYIHTLIIRGAKEQVIIMLALPSVIRRSYAETTFLSS